MTILKFLVALSDELQNFRFYSIWRERMITENYSIRFFLVHYKLCSSFSVINKKRA